MVAVSLLLSGIGLAVYVAAKSRRAQQELLWPKVPGTISRSVVELHGEYFRAIIEYAYVYGDRKYMGDTVRSGDLLYNWAGPAERLCARFPEGTSVDVYIDPANPSQSVLIPGGNRFGRRVMMLISVALIVAGLATLSG